MAEISSNVSTESLLADGILTAFPFDFSILAATDIGVYVDGVRQDYPGDYTVAFNQVGGTVTFAAAPADDATILLVSEPDYLQTSEFADQGNYSLSTVNKINRRATIRDLVTKDKADRALKVPRGETGLEIPLSDVASIVAVGESLIAGSAIPTVATNIADVGAVAGAITNVNVVAGIFAAVSTVAGIAPAVTTVSGVAANVTTVAGIAANVTAVAGVAGGIATLAPISASITTVAGISANVATVAGVAAGVATVATNIGAITTCATNIATIVDAPNQAAIAVAAAAVATSAVGIADTVATGVQLRGLTDGDDNFWLKAKPDRFDYKPFTDLEDRITLLQNGETSYRRLRSLAEYQHYILYGQSLSLGLAGTLVGGTSLPYATKSQAGVRSQDGGTNFATNWATLSDLAETSTGNGGETIATGCAMMIRQILLDNHDIDLATEPGKMLFSAPGQSSTGIVGLSGRINPNGAIPDPVPYTRQIGDITSAAATVNGLGFTYSVQAVLGLHGEADSQANSGAGPYGRNWRRLRSMVEDEVRTLTSHSDLNLPVIWYQVASFPQYSGNVDIALEQLRLALEEEYFALATPMFQFPYQTGGVHLTGTGYRWLGAYFGLAVYKWIIEGTKPAPLLPDRYSVYGNTILVHFPVATGKKLVVDTSITTEPNYGFSIVDAAGSNQTIGSVRLGSNNSVAIACSGTPVPGDWRIRYAYTGSDGLTARGNIRDNSGDTLVFDQTGINKPMHTWAPISQLLMQVDGSLTLAF